MTQDNSKDELFLKSDNPSEFRFDESVAQVFDDMLHRSIPLYEETQTMALRLAHAFVKKNSAVYDLGCSTGNVLIAFADKVSDASVKLVGVDNSAPMLEQARKKLAARPDAGRFGLRQANLDGDLEIGNASVVVMNYTLQFVRPLQREALVRRIHDGLLPGGCLILVEKVLGNDSLFNRLYVEVYYEFKERQGYTDKEISRKREALENVLIPYRLDENIALLEQCGFQNIDTFFKWTNFAGLIAVKS